MATVTHEGGMAFGSNSYDPGFDTKSVFGTDLTEIAALQDYLLFENHAVPHASGSRGNEHAAEWVSDKPVFVVSYQKGIGKEREFSQQDFDRMFSEANAGGFSPCIKGSEYVEKGTWHNLDPKKFTRPRTDLSLPNASTQKRNGTQSLGATPLGRVLLQKFYNPLFRLYMENKLARRIIDPIYFRAIR
jgi:hypothetical protein